MKEIKTKPIGIFDSGVGGLSVVFETKKILPKENIIYIADTLRQPYGEKTDLEVKEYATEIVHQLLKNGVKAIVIACSTATAIALKSLQETIPYLIIEGIQNDSFLHHTIPATKNNRLGIIATNLTTKSQTFSQALLNKAPQLTVINKACPDLVDFISRGDITSAKFISQINKDVEKLLQEEIDSLVLGCTHFTLIAEIFKKLFPDIHIISPPFWTAQYLKKTLRENNISNQVKTEEDSFFCTGNPKAFEDIIYKVTKKNIAIKKIALTKNLEAVNY